ncbi:hypothetical protein J4W70_14690 [Escherichia coli]|uniref:hypothetical protein n=1 Tax=Escherichia TaxID=561 RepID=UPI0021638517|nr:hypothetical protein [Escherichia albertii]EKQ3378343.1 hypothetical protein [Escherichia coli]ELJ4114666.1 hypothetical protein [Escherichia coli]ELO4994232.1 hypothetical protein [Escherichia coli]ELT9992080.1 hypothetical protein [Escherichia coli]MCS1360774.1 hypothetical protein [Escherichia coli]
MQITEALLSEPGEIRRFIQQAVDHWPHLLAFHFTLHSVEGNIDERQIHAFYRAFYRQVSTFIIQQSHAGYPSLPVVLRWLREKQGGAAERCLLLFNQALICPSRASVTVDEGGSQLTELVQQVWRTINSDGQCRVESYFRVTRSGTLDQFVALKTTAQSFMLPVIATIVR